MTTKDGKMREDAQKEGSDGFSFIRRLACQAVREYHE